MRPTDERHPCHPVPSLPPEVRWCDRCQRETRWGIKSRRPLRRSCLSCEAGKRRIRQAWGNKEERERVMQLRELAKIASGPLGHPSRKVTAKSIVELDEALEKKLNGVDGMADLVDWSIKTAVDKEQVYNVVKLLALVFAVKKQASEQRESIDEADPQDIAFHIMESVRAVMTPALFVEIGLTCLSDEDRKDAAQRLLAIEVVPAELR